MGGIWIPHPQGGSSAYSKIFCNKPKDQCATGNHAFLDPKGGMLVQKVIEPRVVIEKDRISRAPR